MGNGRRDRGRATRDRVVTAMLAALLACAWPLGAQTPACRDCEEELETQRRTELRTFEQQTERLARQLAVLAERYTQDATVHRALVQASEAVRTKSESGEIARELARAQRTIAERAAVLDDDPRLMRLANELASLETRAAFTAYVQSPRPSGWLGVTYQGEQEQKSKNGELFVHHHDYPTIISVTHGSPAHKAGVRSGDTLLAYNAHDVRKGAVSLTKLLQPGQTVTLRLRRNGAVRDVPVRVERRETRVTSSVWTTRPEPQSYPRTPAPPGVIRVVPLPPEPAQAVVVAPPPPQAGVYSFSTSTAIIAGAELTAMSDDLRDVFGTDGGVLVLRVAVGTPAEEAGLRSGDVIVRAGGEPVNTMRMVSAQVQAAAHARTLKLEVVRRKQPRTVVLRW